jgi:hypothetical protein
MGGPAPQEAVEAVRLVVEPVAVCRVEPRPAVVLVAPEPDLAREQELAASDDLRVGGEALREVAMVAAEGHVHTPDLAAGEAEARDAGTEDRRRVVAGAALAALALVDPGDERAALGDAFLAPAAR